ncbi:uncharacterized protein YutE (UPF0331/DUF86 family) [Sphingomonas sp. F9_3S_D5_B_2]
MPKYSIRLTNSQFQAQDEPRDYDSLEQAVKAALGSAVDIVRDLVDDAGERSATIEADVLEDERVVARRIVTISALLGDDE